MEEWRAVHGVKSHLGMMRSWERGYLYEAAYPSTGTYIRMLSIEFVCWTCFWAESFIFKCISQLLGYQHHKAVQICTSLLYKSLRRSASRKRNKTGAILSPASLSKQERDRLKYGIEIMYMTQFSAKVSFSISYLDNSTGPIVHHDNALDFPVTQQLQELCVW